MAVQTTGRYTSGKRKGWWWELFQDPASPTGWTKKEWDPKDTSNGGHPWEDFDWYDYRADAEDDQAATSKAERKRAEQAATAARIKATEDAEASVRREGETLTRQQQEADRVESRRRFDDSSGYNERVRTDAINRARESLVEQQRQFNLTYGQDERKIGLDRDKLGLDILKTGASLKGPDDYFQGASFARGVSGAGLAPYLSSFANGTVPAYGGGTATTGNPEPLTLNSLVRDMTGQGSQGMDANGRPPLRPDQQRALDVIDKKFQAGLANAGQGEFENLTDDELAAFKSGGSYLGRAVNDEFEGWRRSRPGKSRLFSDEG